MNTNNEMLIKISGTAKDFIDEVDKVKKKTKELQDVLETTGVISAAAFAAFAASIAYVTKEFADYEKALVGVGKTTDIQGKKLEDFGKQFQELASRIPVSTNELLGIAQAAGQLGVKGEASLLKFTETVAKLGVATDLSGEEAATALTRILTVTGEGVEQIDKFGSVVVALGNNFAATESEIVRVATEVSRATSVFGVSAAEAAALSAALKSVGVQAELGGSAVGRAYRAIDSSLRRGGESLKNLEKLTGMTGEELRKTFAENSTAVFQKFIEGIGRVQASGGDVTQTLAAFKLKGEEILKVLPVLAQRSELVGSALAMANKEMKNATALNEEAARAFDTLASDTQILKNNFTTLATAVGAELAPQLQGLIQGLSSIVKSASELDKGLIPLIASFLKWGAAITASVLGVISAGGAYLAFTRIMGGLRIALQVGRTAMIGFTAAATLGLSVILAFLPEIISGIAEVFAAFTKKPDTDSLDEIARKLLVLQKRKDALADQPNTGFEKNDAQLKAIDDEIEKLKALQLEKRKASADFGDGSLLVKPTADTRGFDPLNGIQTQEIPFAASVDEDPAVQAAKKSEEERIAVQAKGIASRIANITEENNKLMALQALQGTQATEQEKQFAVQRADIETQRLAASLIENDQLREVTLQNNRLKNEMLLEQEAEYYQKKSEQELIQQEQKAALNEILRTMELEQINAMNVEDLENLQKKVETEQQIKQAGQVADLNRKVAERNKFLADEQKYGTQIATMKKFFASEEVQNASDAANALVALQNSKNSQMKAIGKAAASVNAAIATGEGAIKAYSAMAGIPIVGPALGIAAAGAVVAYGAEQQANILGANKGGEVPFSFGARAGVDSVPASLTPGELIVPEKSFDEVVDATANARAGGSSEGGVRGGDTIIVQGDFIGDETYIDNLAGKLLKAKENRNLEY